MVKQPAVYILGSKKHGTLYVGVTSNLVQRIWQYKQCEIDGFTKKYKVHRLVYFEMTDCINAAICREKQLKNWKRIWKIELIEKMNPDWVDLWERIIDAGSSPA